MNRLEAFRTVLELGSPRVQQVSAIAVMEIINLVLPTEDEDIPLYALAIPPDEEEDVLCEIASCRHPMSHHVPPDGMAEGYCNDCGHEI